MKIILLPGLDGTGLLFNELLAFMPDNVVRDVIVLDELVGNSISEHARMLATRYDNSEELLVVAESFSGRLAYELALLIPQQVKHLIFVASFISRPIGIARFAQYLPSFSLKDRSFNRFILKLLGFANLCSTEQLDAVFKSLSMAEFSNLKWRLRQISNMRKVTRKLPVAATYIRPSKEHLVGLNAVNHIEETFQSFEMRVLEGGHFIAQFQPQKCVQIILEKLNSAH
ncbi:MAG: alpha/beta fold hydrolase [Psychrobium sp.]